MFCGPKVMVFAPGRPEPVAVLEKLGLFVQKHNQKQYKNISKSTPTFKTNTPPFGCFAAEEPEGVSLILNIVL